MNQQETIQKTDVTVYESNDQLIVKSINLSGNNELKVDLFDVSGQLISGKSITPTNDAFETSFNISGLAAGTYLVRVGEPYTNFQKVSKVIIH